MRIPICTFFSCAGLMAVVAMPGAAAAQGEEQPAADSVEIPDDPPAEPSGGEEAPAPAEADSGLVPAGEGEPAAGEGETGSVENEHADDEDEQEEEEEEHHKGFFFRFALGLGWAWVNGDGTLPPAKGLERVDDFEHNSPAFNLALSFGGGFLDLGLHLGVLYERMILRSDDPIEMGFTLLGIGGGATYYFTDNDFFVTAQVRLVGMLTYMPGVICDAYFSDKYEWYRGPGFSVTLGKEWFGDDEGGIGVGLQGNYAYLMHSGGFAFHYGSLLLVLTLTRF